MVYPKQQIVRRNIKGKILKTGDDYIVVADTKADFDRTIAARAIHELYLVRIRR